MTTGFIPTALKELQSGLGPPLDSGTIRQNSVLFSGGLDPTQLSPSGFLLKREGPTDRSTFGLFLESALSSGTKELIGSPANREVERFRTENPIGGLTSILAGVAPFFLLPALGPVRALSLGLPGFARALSAADKMQKTGQLFRAGAVREATIFAPLEAARVTGSVFNPEEGSFGRTLQSAGTELAVLGVFGGTIGTLGPGLKHFRASRLKGELTEAEAATEFRVAKDIGPEFNRTASDQSKWEFLQEWQKKVAQTGQVSRIAEDMESLLSVYEGRITTGLAPKNPGKNTTRHVAFLGSRDVTRRVESLYSGTAGARGKVPGILTKVFKMNSKGETTGFDTAAELAASEGGFEQLAKNVRIGKVWQAFTQFPRELVATTPKAKLKLLEILNKDFRKVGEDQWLVQESSEGLWVGVKRLPPKASAGGATGTIIERAAQRIDPASGRFYIFKTNKPSKWFRGASDVYDTNAQVFTRNIHKWGRSALVPDEDVPTLVGMERDMGFFDANQASLHTGKTRFSPDPNVPAETSYLRVQMERYLPEDARIFSESAAGFLNEMGNATRIVAAAGRLQAGQNPRLNNLILQAKRTFDEAAQKSNRTILGPLDPKFMAGTRAPIGSIFKTAINPTVLRRTGGTEKLIRERLSNEVALNDFNRIWEEGMSIEQAVAENLHSSALRLQRELQVLDDVMNKEIAQQAKALGMEESFVPLPGHLRISRTWRGAWRAPIKDADTNEIVGYGSGFTKGQAAEDANSVAKAINEEEGTKILKLYGERPGKDVDLLIKEEVLSAGSKEIEGNLLRAKGFGEKVGLPTDISAAQADIFGFATNIRLGNPMVDRILKTRSKILRSTPVTFKERQGLFRGQRGFIGAIGTSGRRFTVDDIARTHSAGIIETNRYLAREAFAAGPPREQLAKLVLESSADALTFNRIFNSYNGVAGPFGKVLEKATDAVLGDVFGPGVANKIVRGANQAMFTLTLGAMDIGFAALNLITPVQTAIPEVSFLLNTVPEVIQKYYSTALIKVPSGGFRTVRFMDTWKFAKTAMGDVWRPDAKVRESFQWAFEHGAVGRDFIEAVHGPARSIVEGQGGMWDNLARLSEFPVVASEEASRLYSFALGRRVGMDFFRMSEEEARIFGQQFVNNTMFGYAAGDRPRMLTGALGAGWGLFKNWTTNYTGNLARYTAQASRGNFGPLMWAGATTGAVGGLAAVPAAGMADGMSRIIADKPLSDLIYDWVGNDPGDDSKPWMADMMMHGFFSNLGFTLRSRASVPTSHLATDLVMFANISILERAKSGLSALGTAVEDTLDLELPVNNPKFRREMLRAFAPRTLQRAMTTFGEQGVTSLRTGNSLLPALNLFEGSLRTLGMTPVRVANAFEVHQNKIYDAKQKREAIQKLGRRMADAELNRDWREVSRILNDAAWGEGVPIDSVQRSAEARLRKMTGALTDRQLNDIQDRKRLEMRGLGSFR